MSPDTPEAAVNLGSGPIKTLIPGWTALDRHAWPVNISAALTALPFRSGSVRRLHCSHVIEHVDIADVPTCLAEMRRVLARDGILYIAGPDIDRTAAIKSHEWAFYTRHGAPRQRGWGHLWNCGVRKLRALLIDAGLTPTWCKSIPPGWPVNTHAWPLDLEARFLCRRDDFPWPTSFPTGFEVQP